MPSYLRAVSPTVPTQLFVSNAHGATNAGTVSAFSVAGDGTLSSIGASPFADDQTAPCWVELTRDGEFLFTVNTASADISSYAIAPDGALTLLGNTTPGGLGAASERLRTPASAPTELTTSTSTRPVPV